MKRKIAGVLLIFMMAGLANAALTDSLVGYYAFDGNLKDISGSANVNNAAAVGSPDLAAEGLFGNGVKVGGVGGKGQDYVSLGMPSDYLFGDSVSFTFTYWLRMFKNQSSDPTLVGNKDWSVSGKNRGFTQAITADDVKFNIADGTTRADCTLIDLDPDTYFNDGKAHWTFCAFVVDRMTGNITNYVMDEWVINKWDDGSTPTTKPVGTIGSLDSGYPINIGQDGDGAGYDNISYAELVGTFDDMAVWRRALSVDEIWGIYEAGRDGQSFAQYSGIPEPATMLLLALGGLGLVRKRKSE